MMSLCEVDEVGMPRAYRKQLVSITAAATAFHLPPWQVSRIARAHKLPSFQPEGMDRRCMWYPRAQLERLLRVYLKLAS